SCAALIEDDQVTISKERREEMVEGVRYFIKDILTRPAREVHDGVRLRLRALGSENGNPDTDDAAVRVRAVLRHCQVSAFDAAPLRFRKAAIFGDIAARHRRGLNRLLPAARRPGIEDKEPGGQRGG